MKVKFKENKKKDKEETEMTELQAAVGRLNAVIEQVSSVVVDRSLELTALALCFASKEHMMLEGKHGIAKSMMCSQVFARITDAKVFSKQLTSTTQPDEILGCMNSKVYKEEARWEINVEGMLPTAHFAYLDEVYRGARSLLPNLMQILNERTYWNNLKLLSCPLQVAIGTTNFTVNDEELVPFHDRWLVKSNVQPLSALDSKVKAIHLDILRRQGKNPFPEMATVSLKDLSLIQEAVNNVEVSDEALAAFVEMVSHYSKKSEIWISDRRLCQSLKLAQANYVLERKSEGQTFNEMFFVGAKFALCVANNEHQEKLFIESFDKYVGEAVRLSAVTQGLERLAKRVIKMESEYDEKMPANEATELYVSAQKFLLGLRNPTDEFPVPTSGQGKVLYDTTMKKLESLTHSLRATVVDNVAEEIEEEA